MKISSDTKKRLQTKQPKQISIKDDNDPPTNTHNTVLKEDITRTIISKHSENASKLLDTFTNFKSIFTYTSI